MSQLDERLENVKSFFGDIGMDDAVVDEDYEEFMSFKNEQEIDYKEMPTDMQIKDGVNRFKQLALKVTAYMHVKHHEPVPWIFQEEKTVVPEFHLE